MNHFAHLRPTGDAFQSAESVQLRDWKVVLIVSGIWPEGESQSRASDIRGCLIWPSIKN